VNGSPIYGLLAEFDGPGALIGAARTARQAGYERMDAFTPYPVEEVSDALGQGPSRLPLIVLLGGVLGALGGYLLQYWSAVVAYPFNIGGRPAHSWPAFIPATFEMTILCAAVAAVFGMLAMNRLPQPYHPIFNVPSFALASRDRFFLCIESADPRFDPAETRRFLEGLSPAQVSEIER
jgi:hypothetical protein